MRHVVFASYFIDVAVAFKPTLLVVYARSLACGCLAGVGLAFFGCESAACECSYIVIWVDIRYFNIFQWCLASARTDTLHNIKQSCTLVAHNISSVFLSLPAELHGYCQNPRSSVDMRQPSVQ